MNLKDRIRSKVLVVAVSWLAVLGLASFAAAYTNEINGCNQTCETDCTSKGTSCRQASGSPAKCILGTDVSCTNGGGSIELASGNDLDLNGHDITCTETLPSTCAYPAILMGSSATKVTDSVGGSVISGPFRIGVDCAGKSTSIVEKLTINDGLYATVSCQTVRNNIIGGTAQYNIYGTNFGIYTVGISASDSISENYVEGRVWPIFSESSVALDVQKNVLRGTGLSAFYFGYGQANAYGNAKFNIVFNTWGSTTVVSAPSGAGDHVSYDGNFCDPGISGCATCISSGKCMPYTAPFTGN